LNKPFIVGEGKFVQDRNQPLLNDEDLAYQMSPEGGGQGLFWDT
jgi:hypothetical protein